jgi:hypothetical protein
MEIDMSKLKRQRRAILINKKAKTNFKNQEELY